MLAIIPLFIVVTRPVGFFSEGHHGPLILYLYCYHEAVLVNNEHYLFISMFTNNHYFCLSGVGINDIGG